MAWILAATGNGLALDPNRAITQYGHQTWTDRTGFPGQAVYDITQTSDGYLWLRTASRLIRFDGVRFSPLELRLKDETIHERAKSICRGVDGQLLTRTMTHTLRLEDGTTKAVLPHGPAPFGTVSAIWETQADRVWVGTDCPLFATKGDQLFSAIAGIVKRNEQPLLSAEEVTV